MKTAIVTHAPPPSPSEVDALRSVVREQGKLVGAQRAEAEKMHEYTTALKALIDTQDRYIAFLEDCLRLHNIDIPGLNNGTAPADPPRPAG